MALLLDAQHASLRRLVEAVATVYAEGHTRRRAEQELNNSLAVIESSVLQRKWTSIWRNKLLQETMTMLT